MAVAATLALVAGAVLIYASVAAGRAEATLLDFHVVKEELGDTVGFVEVYVRADALSGGGRMLGGMALERAGSELAIGYGVVLREVDRGAYRIRFPIDRGGSRGNAIDLEAIMSDRYDTAICWIQRGAHAQFGHTEQ